jgi:hypothetical protein
LTDNTTTVSCIKKQGSTKSDNCNEIARQIWFWAVDRNVWLTAAHIAGVLNVEADEESRKFRDNLEWTLRADIFSDICAKFGVPTVDLFASRLNCQVPRFYSWLPDPDAEIIDAFTTSWEGEYAYAFPPFNLIGRVLQKMIWERVDGVLIVPNWPTKSWFSMLTRLMQVEPMRIKINANELFIPCRNETGMTSHPLAGKLELWACQLRHSS